MSPSCGRWASRVWSAAVSAQGTVKETAGAVNVPVSVGGQIITPGDAIIADDDGVVCVPRGDIGSALTAARARAAKEERSPHRAGRRRARPGSVRPAGQARRRSGVSYVKAEPGGPDGVRCMLMRGGTSKGAYFLAGDLPADPAERDDLLLRIMGSPDPRQIDGIGGAHPLTRRWR